MCGQLEFQNIIQYIPLFVSNFGAQMLKKMSIVSFHFFKKKKCLHFYCKSKYDDENTIVSNNRALGILIVHAKT